MDQTQLLQRIIGIEDSLDKLKNSVYAMKTTDLQKYPTNYEELSTDAALRAERIACQLRNLIYATGFCKANYMNKAAKVHGIQITSEENILTIRLPGLLPKRKAHVNTSFINEPLHYALKEYLEHNALPLFENCVVCFIQIYDERLPLRRIRDYDNLEFKQILDTISPFVLQDDNGLFCDSYHTTKLESADYTSIHIMDKAMFPKWLKLQKNSLSDLSEIS
ncbi:hypothetical protein CE91St62_39010 [Lachnospiraceae bacterium]|uniref:DUF6100 family protein n=1 Tax=Extibacter sp. GGCC_0201 TaxID=2731209 RepID=UPI001AA17523|nr:DUF6100 family protein [Extibacter sp. GGCC_0201]MBO1720736.1 hypothetical protein [Extibacter sp. GGCC_0201]BDF35839.1 hypothetical protein CE91St61_39140 [Lachnospiraceae bacterium]BDF39840.1 hypothetical protein CE91St62_39010 [Lachnospiraceae bacterium]